MAQSNFDRRRINGPEESFPPTFEDDEGEPSSLGWRLGQPRQGRAASDIRPIFLKAGLITQANGSAYIETQRSKIACAVYGPRQSKSTVYSENGRLNVEVKFAPFSCTRRKVPIRDAEDRSVAVQIHQALLPSIRLELLPKSTIDIFITIIENDGIDGCIAAGSVAASTALADAGIEMLGLVIACSACTIGKEIWLDPNNDEAQASSGTLIYASMPALGTVTNVSQNGRLTPDEAIRCMEACQERCIDIHAVVAEALLENAQQS
ncbi:mRNA transport regulator 3 [Obba rivulosa]|uniref:mRNA transport regulator 3 n=1 Tax=Obba rivulosa TaxID=1052685 RepID=A0A8E2DSI0_9APHY|nr:mRNA transport regulator 3 [Obba rivulosa]